MAKRREKVINKIKGAQNISDLCFVCGIDNSIGLHAHFCNLEDGGVYAYFTPRQEHQSYPGRVHGGILSSLADEAIGRAVQNMHPEIWGVTIELNIKYRKPVPIDRPVKLLSHITKSTKLIFEGEAQIILEDGSIAAEAFGRYAAIPIDKIAKEDLNDSNWLVDSIEVPTEVVI